MMLVAGHRPDRVRREQAAQREALLAGERVEDAAHDRLVVSRRHGSAPIRR